MKRLIDALNDVLATQQYRWVSVDIFDTLVFRDIAQPEEIAERAYANVANQIPLALTAAEFAELRKVAQQKARAKRADREVTLEEIYAQMPFSAEQVTLLLNSELAIEKQVSQIADELLDTLLAWQQKGCQLLLISDMYLSATQIRETFFQHYPALAALPLYVSCEHRASKVRGDLFKRVAEHQQIDPQEWLHIGDNPVADGAMARHHGIEVFSTEPAVPLNLVFKAEFSLENTRVASNVSRQLCSVFDAPPEYKVAHIIGASVFGPVLMGFADWVIDTALNLKLQKIVCLMRDAHTLTPVIAKRLVQRGIDALSVTSLSASRKSTFWSAVDVQQPDWLESLLARLQRRRGLTLANVCDLLGVSIPVQLDAYADYELRHCEKLMHQGNSVLNGLLQYLSEFSSVIAANVAEHRQLLSDYFYQQIECDLSQVCVVDFGNGGSIQHHLEQACNKRAGANLLLFSSQRIYEHNTLVSAYFGPHCSPSYLRQKFRRSPECVEALLLGAQGTTLSYQRRGEAIVAQQEPALARNGALSEAFLHGCLSFMQRAHEQGGGAVSAQQAAAILNRYIQRPTAQEAAIFKQVWHEDNFGANDQFTVISEEQVNWMRNEGVANALHRFDSEPNYQFGFVHWPQAVASLIDADIHFIKAGLISARTASAAERLARQVAEMGWTSFTLYGAGEFFQQLLPYLHHYGLQIERLVDRQAELKGQYTLHGYEVMGLTPALAANSQRFVIASYAFRFEIAERINQYANQHGAQIEVISL